MEKQEGTREERVEGGRTMEERSDCRRSRLYRLQGSAPPGGTLQVQVVFEIPS
jgi:hypothetical protein